MKTILVTEDENSIRDFISFNLKNAGYNVIEAENGENAIKQFNENRNEIDIILLDIMLPGISGFEVCEYIRKNDKTTGIIYLTAKTQEEDILNGLRDGGDDYITKPFSIAELIARVDTLYRRVSALKSADDSKSDILTCGKFTLDLIKHNLNDENRNIELTQIEFQILECFFRNKDQIITRKYILEKVWGGPYYGDDKVVDVNIRRLRVKIEDDASNPKHLITLWGKGYIFK